MVFERSIQGLERRSAGQFFEARYAELADSAGNDPGEMRQVGRDIDRQAVKGHPAAHANADRANLGFLGPLAGPDPDPSGFATCFYAERAKRADHPALERMDEAADVAPAPVEVEVEIDDALA